MTTKKYDQKLLDKRAEVIDAVLEQLGYQVEWELPLVVRFRISLMLSSSGIDPYRSLLKISTQEKIRQYQLLNRQLKMVGAHE